MMKFADLQSLEYSVIDTFFAEGPTEASSELYVKIEGYGDRFWCKYISLDNGVYHLRANNIVIPEHHPFRFGDELIISERI